MKLGTIAAVAVTAVGLLLLQDPGTAGIGLGLVIAGAAGYNKTAQRPIRWYWMVPILIILAVVLRLIAKATIYWFAVYNQH